MPDPTTDARAEPQAPKPRFQFSTRSLLIATAAAALLLAYATAVPSWFVMQFHGLISMSALAALVSGAVVLKGEKQVFCLAAIAPLFSSLSGGMASRVWLSEVLRQFGLSGWAPGMHSILLLVGQGLAMLLSGVIGVAVARWLKRRGWVDQDE